MTDVTKLPKWAQARIAELEANQSLTGANIEGVNIEMCGFKHNPESSTAICAVANALAENAKALGILAGNIVPRNIHAEFGSGVHVSDVRGR